MPELPEVHGYQQFINATAMHQKIVAMNCRDDRLLKKPIAQFKSQLIGEKWVATDRIGKYLFITLSNGAVLVMHFGMTGRPNYYFNPDDRPRFGHIVLTFENGYHFAFENKRKFGWWDLTDSIEGFRIANQLSKDARDLSFAQFKEAVSGRKTAIKNVIMNQSVTAGVGNWIADDVLYQSRIHPQTKVSELNEEKLRSIYDKLQHVIEVAIDKEAHYADFPEYFLIHNRKGRERCYHTGDELVKIKVGGRTTYVSENWQNR